MNMSREDLAEFLFPNITKTIEDYEKLQDMLQVQLVLCTLEIF